jgi:hypothetical protein
VSGKLRPAGGNVGFGLKFRRKLGLVAVEF